MRKFLHLVPLFVVVVLAACSSAPSQPALSEGNYVISAVTDPSPPVLGVNRLVVTVNDKSGAPVSGARVRLSAEMITHSMGVQSGDAQDDGGGKYSLRAGFGMAGGWKVIVDVSKAGMGEGSKRFDFEVK